MGQIKNSTVVLLSVLMLVLMSCGTSNTPKESTVSPPEIQAEEQAEAANSSILAYEKFKDFEHHLYQENDKVYVINFWATWCKPCIAELPYFEQIQAKYKDENVEVILVSLDDMRKLESKVIPFIEKNKLQSEVILLDDAKYNSWIDKVSTEWSGAIPATLFYNKNKREFYEQEFDYQELEGIVKSFL